MDALIQEKQRRGLKEAPVLQAPTEAVCFSFNDGKGTQDLDNEAFEELYNSYVQWVDENPAPSSEDIDRLRRLEKELEERTAPEQTKATTKSLPAHFEKLIPARLSDENLRKVQATLKPRGSIEDRLQLAEVEREINQRGISLDSAIRQNQL